MNGYDGRLTVEWENINLQDEVELANARLRRAPAEASEQKTEAERNRQEVV